MFKKIRFYKAMLVEVLETLCTICLYLDVEGRRNHNYMATHLKSHFNELKSFSEELRKEKK